MNLTSHPCLHLAETESLAFFHCAMAGELAYELLESLLSLPSHFHVGALGLHICIELLQAFYLGSGDLNSGLRDCVANNFTRMKHLSSSL